jgi:hypothetical protein
MKYMLIRYLSLQGPPSILNFLNVAHVTLNNAQAALPKVPAYIKNTLKWETHQTNTAG